MQFEISHFSFQCNLLDPINSCKIIVVDQFRFQFQNMAVSLFVFNEQFLLKSVQGTVSRNGTQCTWISLSLSASFFFTSSYSRFKSAKFRRPGESDIVLEVKQILRGRECQCKISIQEMLILSSLLFIYVFGMSTGDGH